LERRNLLFLLTAVAALAAGCPGVGPTGGDEGAARFAETASRDEASGPEAPDRADGRALALLIFDEGLRDDARRAVTARGGRVLVAFDEPALVVRFPVGAPYALEQELPGVALSTGPIDDVSLAASAPRAVGFWNRRHGVDGPLAQTAPAGPMARPVGHALSRRPLGPEQELAPELDRRARDHLRGFLECLGEAPSHEVCLEGFVAPEEQDRLRTLLAREDGPPARFE